MNKDFEELIYTLMNNDPNKILNYTVEIKILGG